ncbi:MAG: hypothetical protein ACD_18C00344G0001, partial [uncultured bacterium]
IHASDSIENAQAEVGRFFEASEIHEYDKSDYQHVYAEEERTK